MGRFICQLKTNKLSCEKIEDKVFFQEEFIRERLNGKKKYLITDENIKLVMYQNNKKQFYLKGTFNIFGNIWIKDREKLEKIIFKFNEEIIAIKEDLEFIKIAYEYLGIKFLDYLDGEYNLVIHDGEIVYLINDCFSSSNMFFMYDKNKLYISNFLESFLEYNNINFKFYEDYFTNKGYILSSNTPFEKVKRVPAGNYMKVNIVTDEILEYEYWNLEKIKINHSISFNEAKDKFTKILSKSIINCCRGYDSIGISLSGGLDSTTIACLVKEKEIVAFSSVFEKYKLDDEKSYLTNTCKINNIKLCLIKGDLLSTYDGFPDDAPITQLPYGNIATYKIQKKIYESAKQEGLKVVLTGLGGDEVLSGTNYFNHDLFFSGHLIKSITNVKNIAKQRGESIGYNIKKYIFSPLKSVERFQYGKKREISRIKENLLPMITEYISDIDNIIIRHPYLDRDLIEFMLSLPVKFKISPKGHKKYLLRVAMKGIIPDQVLKRVDKTSHFGIIYGGLKKEWPKLSKILNISRYEKFKIKYKIDNDILGNVNFDMWAFGGEKNELTWVLANIMLWDYKMERIYDKFIEHKQRN